jgi:hypothetical protein
MLTRVIFVTMSDIGEGLYRLVTEYAELGDHRTASDVDAATRSWFEAKLGAPPPTDVAAVRDHVPV